MKYNCSKSLGSMDTEAQKALKGEIQHVLFLYSSLSTHFWPLLETQYWATLNLQSDPPQSLICHLQGHLTSY